MEYPFENQVRAAVTNNELAGQLAEACVASHFARQYPTYYIKQKQEVDVAYVKDGGFWPVEIKWSGQVRAADIKQASKYGNAEVWAKVHEPRDIENLAIKPLPLELYLI
jgi:predicted AAA+ superfamily ATPase